MRSVERWKQVLREALREAMRARAPEAVSVFREVLGALDNAEAAELALAPAVEAGRIAGGVSGLGAGEVPRRVLGQTEVAALLAREVVEREAAAARFEALGEGEAAAKLRRQVGLLAAVLSETRPA
jgi:hypothetical protein